MEEQHVAFIEFRRDFCLQNMLVLREVGAEK